MDRRNSIKALALTAVSPDLLLKGSTVPSSHNDPSHDGPDKAEGQSFASDWSDWPDMNWVGPGFWGNRLQDWRIKGGRLECLVKGRNRTLHCLTTQLKPAGQPFETSVNLHPVSNSSLPSAENYAGFRLGAKATERFNDYRCAAVFGEGLDAGITGEGYLFIGTTKSSNKINIADEVILDIKAIPLNEKYQLKLSVIDAGKQVVIDELAVSNIAAESLTGNIALVVHYANEPERSLGITERGIPLKETGPANKNSPSGADAAQSEATSPSIAFSNWTIKGPAINNNPSQTFGPVCFAQYTLHKKILKLTAQAVPVDEVPRYTVALQLKNKNDWETIK
jgi:hypothetical protein